MAPETETHAVTGALSYTGRYITDSLRRRGIGVRALVRAIPQSDALALDCRQLQFVDARQLSEDLRGVTVLYNTYWIRFERGATTFDTAVRNTAALAQAAQRAGVRRIVHLSVSNASHASPFGYFRGKAAAEDAVHEAGIPLSIVRPTLVFGREDILINNIAWLLRRFHLFIVPGAGTYRVQPVYVGDVAELAIQESAAAGSRVLDAAGPEVVPFNDVVSWLRHGVHARALIGHAPRGAVLAMTSALSAALRDTLLTREELGALAAETLISTSPPTASTALSSWIAEHGGNMGRTYTSELRRHWSRTAGS